MQIIESLCNDFAELRGQSHRLRQSAIFLFLERGGGSRDPAVYRCRAV